VTFEPEAFEFLIDRTTRMSPVIGLRISASDGYAVTVPMSGDTANDIGELLIAHAHSLQTGNPHD